MKQYRTPRQALSKAYLKSAVTRREIDLFKKAFASLKSKLPSCESEPEVQNEIRDFLKDALYTNEHYINSRGKADLVIYDDSTVNSKVGVIIEAKKLSNTSEMASRDNINAKALQELLLYYLRERHDEKNLSIKHLIITNGHEWFIFNGNDFEKYFANKKELTRGLEATKGSATAKGDTGKSTAHFYKNVAKPFIEKIKDELPYIWFDISDYEEIVSNDDAVDDKKLIALFKLLSPTHILKKSFANDSNSLNRDFYNELLHIIGLEEVKERNKKVIKRKRDGKRESASLLENTINILKYETNVKENSRYDTALELCITWINRILFLKLLESQLVKYHRADKQYQFLNYDKIRDYDTLNRLFFQVLAIKSQDRRTHIQELYGKIPYLNSSLFEVSRLESKTLKISNLEDQDKLSIHPRSKLRDNQGKTKKGKINTLQYLFEFLESYDFSSEGGEQIQEENKTLINASVLGLIFEKINGYKDGSFFTPGFITMYMCKETIRRAVVDKFNKSEGWKCKSITDVYNKIEHLAKANQIINDLKICDPAVGSGHFLVSSLNELIAIKSDLGILMDKNGKKLKNYSFEVINDELIVTDEDGIFYEYNIANEKSRRVQETIFHEKQTIIENCLFGVDINPNSVKICRLRLWIELLKNAYYTEESKFTDLETLPNIDINIKCGNSLISRFNLDSNLKPTLKKSKFTIDSYKSAVSNYKSATNKEQKREFRTLIESIKSTFQSQVRSKDKIDLQRIEGKFYDEFKQEKLIDVELNKVEVQKRSKRKEKMLADIQKQKNRIEEIENNKIYENAFEWRFEFPEVLNDEGEYLGFDVVIGNPPYMRVQEIEKTQPNEKIYYEQYYSNVAQGAYDLANIFFERAIQVSNESSQNGYIFPHKFLNSAAGESFRDYLSDGKFLKKIIHFGANMIFSDADTYTCIALFQKKKSANFKFYQAKFKSDFIPSMYNEEAFFEIDYAYLERNSLLYGSNQWICNDSSIGQRAFEKLFQNSTTLKDVLKGIFVGLQTSKDDLYVVDLVNESPFIIKVPYSNETFEVEKELFKPMLRGKDVHRYKYLSTSKFVFFPYAIEEGQSRIVTLKTIREQYPLTYQYVLTNESRFKSRESNKAAKMENWHGYIYEKNLTKFELKRLSSMEICAKHPNVTLNNNFYHNTKVYSWLLKPQSKISYELLLAIANSKVLWWFLKLTGDTLQGDARTFKTNYLNPFPVPIYLDQLLVAKIEALVSKTIDIKKTDPEIPTIKFEDEIDQLVYDVYKFNSEEVEYIEKYIA